MPGESDVILIMEVAATVEVLCEQLRATHNHGLHCFKAAPSPGIVSCTYHHWF